MAFAFDGELKKKIAGKDKMLQLIITPSFFYVQLIKSTASPFLLRPTYNDIPGLIGEEVCKSAFQLNSLKNMITKNSAGQSFSHRILFFIRINR